MARGRSPDRERVALERPARELEPQHAVPARGEFLVVEQRARGQPRGCLLAFPSSSSWGGWWVRDQRRSVCAPTSSSRRSTAVRTATLSWNGPQRVFHSIPFHSIPFHSIPFHSIPFHDTTSWNGPPLVRPHGAWLSEYVSPHSSHHHRVRHHAPSSSSIPCHATFDSMTSRHTVVESKCGVLSPPQLVATRRRR